MRLRGIELTNIRRFAGRRAVLAEIGDGITVLSEPNEFGKSTFFDSLHAVFFERHRSTRAPVKALQPHAGGAPEVAVEVELPEGRFRIAKRWLSRPQARITDAAGRIVAQDDEAEAWIDRLLGGDLAGPSGLLWVRQGLIGLEPEGSSTDERRERERGLATRRGLLSSVAGEIDMMTGGRRMDAVLDRVAADLARYATATGRPRAGGDWARALEEAETLAAQEAELRPRAARLSQDLARRAEVQRTLSRLTDPAEARARVEAVQRAEATLQAALDHKARVDRAAASLRMATLDAEAAEAEVARLDGIAQRLEQAHRALAEAETVAAAAQVRAAELAARDRTAALAAEAAAATLRDLRDRLTRAERARAAEAARHQAGEWRRRLDRATALLAERAALQARRDRLTVTAQSLSAAEQAQAALDQARARAEARAVTVEARPAGAGQALMAGRPLPDGPQPILTATEIVLPGFGALWIDPGQAQAGEAAAGIATATAALDRALRDCSAPTLAAARQALTEAQALDAQLAQTAAVLAEVAPKGPEVLRAALAQAEAAAAEAGDGAGAEDPAALFALLDRAQIEAREAEATARAAHDAAVKAGEARAQAEGERRTAERRLSETLAELGTETDLPARRAVARDRLPGLVQARVVAAEVLAALQADAPDLATAEAGLTRARGSLDAARQAEARAREELAELHARIDTLAEEGIEERLADLSDRRAEALSRASRCEAEVRALTRLRRALEEARTAARDAYFGPALRELQPLLAILHPGAQLSIDDQSLLPAILTRDGQEEALDILSGGTREQVAILTRLAFARLFAASGRPVPVILDDALVHSDDDRIEAMFTALHRVARDQQILVLTCRQRAFAALGGRRAEVRVEEV